MRYTVVLDLAGPLAGAAAVEWTTAAAPQGSGDGWEPCLQLPDGRWRLSSHDLARPRHWRDPGLFANIGNRYRLTAGGPWSPVSATRKEIVILDGPEDPQPVISVIGTKALESPGSGLSIEQFLVRSVVANRDVMLRVMLPSGYAAGSTHYPVLYTLGGQSSPLSVFTSMSNLRNAMATKPMIVVTFDNDAQDDGDISNGGDSWYVDSPQLPKSQFTSFFRDELIPFIDAHYRTLGAAKRAVTGFSMGAWGAMHYLCECPEGTFNSVSGMSGSYIRVAKTQTFMNTVLGTITNFPARWQALELDRRFLAKKAAGFDFPPLMLTVGLSDVLAATREFRDFLVNESIAFEYDERAGSHDYDYWKTVISLIVDFHWRKFNAA